MYSDDELLEMLVDNDQTSDGKKEIKNILRTRKVEFEDFDDTRSSSNYSKGAVGGILIFVLFLIFKLLRNYKT